MPWGGVPGQERKAIDLEDGWKFTEKGIGKLVNILKGKLEADVRDRLWSSHPRRGHHRSLGEIRNSARGGIHTAIVFVAPGRCMDAGGWPLLNYANSNGVFQELGDEVMDNAEVRVGSVVNADEGSALPARRSLAALVRY
jgi:hypothetical protein